MSILDEYKRKMKVAPDLGVPGNESDIVKELLESPPDKVDAILGWIFSEHKGYVEPRVKAGQRFLERNPERGWLIIEQLMHSSDPDDRDVAVIVLERAGVQNKFYLAKPLLNDPYPYLQFEGIELLADIFCAETKAILQNLLNHRQEWVRENAQQLLTKMDKDN